MHALLRFYMATSRYIILYMKFIKSCIQFRCVYRVTNKIKDSNNKNNIWFDYRLQTCPQYAELHANRPWWQNSRLLTPHLNKRPSLLNLSRFFRTFCLHPCLLASSLLLPCMSLVHNCCCFLVHYCHQQSVGCCETIGRIVFCITLVYP